MARKTLALTEAGARYGTRMMKAGDPIELSGPNARLFQALGWAGEGARVKGAEPLPEQKPDKDDQEAAAPKRSRRKRQRGAK